MEGSTPGTDLKPGEICSQSGLYRVIHRAHRMPHKAVISQGDIFPSCSRCGAAVRFKLIMATGAEASARGAGQSS
jgi:hypothetical protein